MKFFLLVCFIVSLIDSSRAQDSKKHISLNNRITISFELGNGFKEDSIDIAYMPNLNILGFSNEKTQKVATLRERTKAKWTFASDKLIYLRAGDLTKRGKEIIGGYFFEPGDSIILELKDDRIYFKGNNTAKFDLQKLIIELQNDKKAKPNTSMFNVTSFESYSTWNSYLDRRVKLALPIIDSFKSKMTDLAWNEIRISFLSNIQYAKCWIWSGLRTSMLYSGESKLFEDPKKVLAELFDRDFYTSDLVWMRSQPLASAGNWDFIKQKIYRDCLFSSKKQQIVDIAGKSGSYTIDLCRLFLQVISETYSGLAKESCVASVMCSSVIRNGAYELGFPPEYDNFLDKYYTGPYSSEYKGYVKKYEEMDRLQGLYNGYKLNSHFSLPDEKGKTHDYALLRGKIAFICFWESDNAMNDFETIYSKFKENNNIVFLNISVVKDKNSWLKSIQTNKYKRPGIINLYTQGLGKEHPVIKALLIDSFPQVAILSASGRVFKKENNGELVDGIEKEISKLYDGPYIFTNDAEKKYYTILGVSVLTGNIDENAPLTVATDRYNKTFPLKLKQSYNIVSSVYEQPEKIIALSDIEGNFDAFRKLLQTNKVIDERLNWIFGSGHLVFAGDMFDRGEQVTECLWLIYSLEEKAKAAGGYVHFVLGNHEIMNLQGNHSYTKEKYHYNAKLIGKSVTELYNEDSELGRWLRTKNIIEKIGNLLFLHGGISPEVNRLPLTLQQINDLARPYYAGGIDSTNKNLMTLYDTRKGERYYISPFWSRGYYREEGKLSDEQLDSTLQKFNVSRIITGHTIVADTISVHYGGKVINTDTKHAEGKSEALLIEGDHYYRVNQEGKRVLLFIDDKKKTPPSAQ